ncbi:rhomboid family intramembrane serine protease [Bartonella acomydis]|uniref:Rhomboid family intramembrane serine protease n=1 Tax=Bartonella acomydis TaxID=686234 RepID=A0ABP9MEE0_9HYPH
MKDANQQNNVSFFSQQPKESLLNIPFMIVVMITLCFCIYIIPQYFFSYTLSLESFELFSFTPVLFKTEPLAFCYTIITYSFMHGSFQHVALNMAWLLVFGTPLVRHLGSLRFLFFWILTAMIAVLTYFVFHHNSAVSLVGASGAVCGMMGAIIRYVFPLNYLGSSMQNDRFLGPLLPVKKVLRSKSALVFVCLWLSIDFIIGIFSSLFAGEGTAIAWEAHIGGFFSGFLLIRLFDTSRKKLKTMI